jgi:hypothetical protein
LAMGSSGTRRTAEYPERRREAIAERVNRALGNLSSASIYNRAG